MPCPTTIYPKVVFWDVLGMKLEKKKNGFTPPLYDSLQISLQKVYVCGITGKMKASTERGMNAASEENLRVWDRGVTCTAAAQSPLK